MNKIRALAFQPLMALGLTGISAGHIYKALKSHETLWVVVACVETSCFLGFGAVIIYMMIKNNKKAA
jgi:hypothetical protein